MTLKKQFITLLAFSALSCLSPKKETFKDHAPGIRVVGAMRNVMHKGDMTDKIALDTISSRKGLYGLGPLSHLKGELLINNGKSYISKVSENWGMEVTQSHKAASPFFVYAKVEEWEEIILPHTITTIKDVEKFIEEKTSKTTAAFAFKLEGEVAYARIHVLNLSEGTKVSSPSEAHQGQIDYEIKDEEAEIVGFYSTSHQGGFTHHDSRVHMHLITANERKMGHLDDLRINKMKLYLPAEN